jgi:hypothetical protein
MTARVSSGLIEGPQAVPVPPSPHSPGHLPEGHVKGKPGPTAGPALCANPVGQ